MRTRKRSRSILLGLAMVAVFTAAALFAVTAQKGLPGAAKTTVRAAFADVGSLRVGDDVRIASVRVGQVSAINLEHGQAVADLKLTDVDKVYRNASVTSASVGARSALGLKFVDLKPGTPDAGEIPPDAVIPASNTTGAQDITDLLTVLDKPTRDALGSSLRQTGGGLAGHAGDLHDAVRSLPRELPDLGTISRALSADGGADTTRVMQALDQFAGRFTGRQEEIAGMARHLGTTLDAVTVDDGKPLGQALAKAPQTLADVRGGLNTAERPLADTRAAMTDLRPGAQALARATPDLRGVLREAPTPLDKLPGVARQAEPAVADLSRVMADARPIAPRLRRAVNVAADPLATLGAYSQDISAFFSYVTNSLSDGDDAGHWVRFFFVPGPEMVSGVVPGGVKDPLHARDPYAPPGQAVNQRKTVPMGPGE